MSAFEFNANGNALAQLVARANGRADAVVPRLPGLYEPISSHATAHVSHADPSVEDARLQSKDVATEPDAYTPSAPSWLRTKVDVHAAAPAAPQRAGTEANIVPSEPDERVPALSASTSHNAATSASRSAMRRDLPDLAGVGKLLLPPRVTEEVRPPRTPPAVLVASRPETDFDPLAALPARARAPFGEARQTPHSDAMRQGELRPKEIALAPQRDAPAHDSARQLPPAVHISIGRIEVRATPASGAAASKPVNAHRPMSLEEYLKRAERAR